MNNTKGLRTIEAVAVGRFLQSKPMTVDTVQKSTKKILNIKKKERNFILHDEAKQNLIKHFNF